MRVPYTSRRKRAVKRSKPTAPVEQVIVLPAPIEEEDEDDFNFIAIDELDDSHSHSQSQQSAVCESSSSSLYPIAEQSADADLALSILEGFFFGETNATKKQVSPPTTCMPASPTASPTSTLLHPVCSCPHLDTATNHFSTDSLTSSPRQPIRPAMKQRPRSNSDLSNSKRNVSFTEIQVREYDVELSDHPSCSYGPPIQLGWDYQETHKTSVEDYEVTRSPHRREVHELVLSYNTRRRRLKQSGYRKAEIQRAQQEVDRIKRERLITEFFLPASVIDETLEKVVENVKGWFRPRTAVCQIHNSPQI